MNKEEKIKQLKMQQAYERYVGRVLEIMKKKLDVIADFRIKAGKEKLRKLRKEVEE